jgi:GcrA cell cycle regulator
MRVDRNTRDWSDCEMALLEQLWSTVGPSGHPMTTLEIGQRLGRPKNSIVGKAHRMRLPARPSPMGKGTLLYRPGAPPLPHLSTPRAVPKAPRVTLPSLAAEALPPSAPAFVPRPFGAVRACCWPFGEPGSRDFRFCDAPSLPAKVYCHEHYQRAYPTSSPSAALHE